MNFVHAEDGIGRFFQKEIVEAAEPVDPAIWVPQDDGVFFRPLMFDTVRGSWSNLLKVKRAGVLTRHRHPGAVIGMVLRGSWHYLEHDWVARPGDFVFEPPGEIHTLTVDEGDEMVTFFNIQGAMIYLDKNDRVIGYDDVFTKIEMCRSHYANVGLAGYEEQFIR